MNSRYRSRRENTDGFGIRQLQSILPATFLACYVESSPYIQETVTKARENNIALPLVDDAQNCYLMIRNIAPLAVRDLNKILPSGQGIASHVPLRKLQNKLARIIDDHTP